MDLWEAAEAPPTREQMTDRTDERTAEEKTAGPVTDTETPGPQPTSGATRESELLALIHDLNDCNDVLLARVAKLEGDLKTARSIFKAEVAEAKAEAAQTKEAAKSAQERMAQQVSAEHAAAQQMANNAQQQVAKLLSEIEVAEQRLSRQQLVSENLQTELSNSQERIIQLERECALLAQEHAEQAQARIQAETTARDLRSRLQRQQRYTLQFKAALEKSLSVSAQPANSSEVARPVSFQDPTSVVMPKAHRIMPWAAGGATTSFQGIDPHLEVLIRGVSKPSEPKVAMPQAPAEAARSPVASPEAKAELWQDLERVLGTETEVKPANITNPAIGAEAANPSDHPSPNLLSSDLSSPDLSSPDLPKLNWQSESKAETQPETSKAEANVIAPAEPIAPAASQPAASQPTASQPSEPEVLFTEPSPWGNPSPDQAANPADCLPADCLPADYLPAIDSPAASAVSPVVKPLRSQKKISMASVELPTFPNAKVASFKR